MAALLTSADFLVTTSREETDMITATLKNNNLSVFRAEDGDVVSLELDHIKRNEEYIYGLPEDEVTLYLNVGEPEDWSSGKYFFDGVNWSRNPDWIDPEEALV